LDLIRFIIFFYGYFNNYLLWKIYSILYSMELSVIIDYKI
jgi:hypothetical protein